MEEAKSKLNLDYEVKRNMYKYHYATLTLQRSLMIVAMQKDKNTRTLTQRSFLYWKNFAIREISSQKLASVEVLSNITHALSTINRIIRNRTRDTLQAALYELFEYSTIKRMKDLKNIEQKKIEAVHQFELDEMNNELRHLQHKQAELQSIMIDLKEREVEYVCVVEELGLQRQERFSKQEKSRLKAKEREEEIKERIFELKHENAELREKLQNVENNVSLFIKSMTYLLENERVSRRAAGTPKLLDDLNYKEKKSPSTQRRVKNTPRRKLYTGNSKHPLINIDMVK